MLFTTKNTLSLNTPIAQSDFWRHKALCSKNKTAPAKLQKAHPGTFWNSNENDNEENRRLKVNYKRAGTMQKFRSLLITQYTHSRKTKNLQTICKKSCENTNDVSLRKLAHKHTNLIKETNLLCSTSNRDIKVALQYCSTEVKSRKDSSVFAIFGLLYWLFNSEVL